MGGMERPRRADRALPAGVVVTDPDTVEKYRFDWSKDAGAGTPVAVVRAEDAEPGAGRRCAGRPSTGVPVVPRGRRAAASRAASSAVDGGIVLSLERMRAIEIDTDCQVAVVEPGAFNAEVKAAAARARPLVPARPVVVRDLLDRRQRRHQRRRAVLREVRRHHRLRPRARRRARRRHPGHARRQADQGRRRAVACSSCSSAARARSGSSPGRSCGWCRRRRPRATLVASFAVGGGRRARPWSRSAARCGPR